MDQNENVSKRGGVGVAWGVTLMQLFHIRFLMEYLVRKLLTKVTRFFVNFIKIPDLNKINSK